MLLFQRLLLLVALGISVFMLAPPTSPVMGDGPDMFSRPADNLVAVPTPAPSAKPVARPKPTAAKGVILSGYSAGGERLDRIAGMIRRTELNAVVIDIKDETGQISWVPSNAAVRAVGAGRKKIGDPGALMDRLNEEGIYVIGRIVTMQDPILSEARPDLAVRDTKGGIWRNEKKLGWGDPYSREVWEYNFALAEEAIDLGFDEIQFDYIRFPSDGDIGRIWYSHADGRHPTEVIRSFFAEARSRLVRQGVYLSADLFGLVTLAEDDMGIGQKIELIAQEVDYISLMLYPSHYTKGNYGIRDPEKDPYRTVKLSVEDAKRRINGTRARLRPWIQDFSLRVRYTPAHVRAQIKALEEEGVHEFLLWNASNRYSEDALRPDRSRRRATPTPRS
jgi:hypothetical protein